MAFIKTPANLFLGKIELNRLKDFLDKDGFRKLFLNNSLKFGLFQTSFDTDFQNGLVENGGSAGTINHKDLLAVNSEGNFIVKPQQLSISVPDDDTWYWVRVTHLFSPNELGLVSIDGSGNLTGVGTQFLTTLRGGVDFPSKIKFTDAINNTLEYEVVDVIDNENAVLSGVFTSESNLKYCVVGTFTRGVTPPSQDKNIFQYDSCTLDLVEETLANDPSNLITQGSQFMLARVRYNSLQSSQVQIQDKRRNYVYQTKADFLATKIDRELNPLIGIESIRWDNSFSPQDKNLVYLGWSMKSASFTVNTSQRLVTINQGLGGMFKTTDDFTTGDFNGWRLYTGNGRYSRIISSIKNGSQIDLILDSLDVNDYSSDGGITFDVQIINIVPDCEEVIIRFDAQGTGIPSQEFAFPSNTIEAKAHLLAYGDPTSVYTVNYKYKKTDEYTSFELIPDDIDNGYFNENQFDSNGDLILTPARTTYTNGQITLNINAKAYRKQIQAIDLGDLLGVETSALPTTAPFSRTLTVGQDRQYQVIEGGAFTLPEDYTITLADGIRNGNFFLIQIKQAFTLNGKLFRVQDSSANVIRNIEIQDEAFVKSNSLGLFIQFTWNGTDWIVNSVNEVNTTPVGSILDYAGSSAPNGWFICQGQTVSRTVYSRLFSVLGTTFGAGDGTTTFNLPDLRSRVTVGLGVDSWNDTLGETGGTNEVTLTEAQLPEHNHDKGTLNITSSGSHKHGYSTNDDQVGGLEAGNFQRAGNGNTSGLIGTGSGENKLTNESHTHSSSDFDGETGNTGDGEAHTNLQPYIVLNKIIKF